jgi:hypothetical protein
VSAATGHDALLGTWDVSIRTPVGSLVVVYTFEETALGLEGLAEARGERVELQDITTTAGSGSGLHVAWRQAISRPMRLRLEFDVVVDGDRLDGHSRAGRLPRSAVEGRRRRS